MENFESCMVLGNKIQQFNKNYLRFIDGSVLPAVIARISKLTISLWSSAIYSESILSPLLW